MSLNRGADLRLRPNKLRKTQRNLFWSKDVILEKSGALLKKQKRGSRRALQALKIFLRNI